MSGDHTITSRDPRGPGFLYAAKHVIPYREGHTCWKIGYSLMADPTYANSRFPGMVRVKHYAPVNDCLAAEAKVHVALSDAHVTNELFMIPDQEEARILEALNSCRVDAGVGVYEENRTKFSRLRAGLAAIDMPSSLAVDFSHIPRRHLESPEAERLRAELHPLLVERQTLLERLKELRDKIAPLHDRLANILVSSGAHCAGRHEDGMIYIDDKNPTQQLSLGLAREILLSDPWYAKEVDILMKLFRDKRPRRREIRLIAHKPVDDKTVVTIE